MIKSEDDGNTWSEPIVAAYDGEKSRCFDGGLWIDPLGRLWFFWNVMPQFAVYASVCDDPDAKELTWSKPFVIGKEIMLNKPTVLSTGAWVFPIAVWASGLKVSPNVHSKSKKRLAFMYKTNDAGKTFIRLGGVNMPERCFDEHMFIERKDGTVSMYVRTYYGIGVSYSYDGGLSWTQGKDSGLGGPCSRFFIRTLKSGNILLVNHVNFVGRNNLTALISRDGGQTFEGGLVLDERSEVSYPDGTEDGDGFIYVIYDRERGSFQRNLAGNQKCAREILFAKFTEEDVLAGKIVTLGSRLSLFYDGEGNLWLWWNQTNYSSGDKFVGIWNAKISNPGISVNGSEDLSKFEISPAERVCDGLKMNKPTILSSGEWAFFSHNFARQGYTEIDVLDDLLRQSEVYQEGKTLQDAKAAIRTPVGATLEEVRQGNKILSDRTQHVWDQFVPNAFVGMTYLSDKVLEAAQVQVIEDGYLLLLASSSRAVSADWTLLVKDISNPGVDVAQAYYCYVAYFEAGDTVDVATDAILLGIDAESSQ